MTGIIFALAGGFLLGCVCGAWYMAFCHGVILDDEE